MSSFPIQFHSLQPDYVFGCGRSLSVFATMHERCLSIRQRPKWFQVFNGENQIIFILFLCVFYISLAFARFVMLFHLFAVTSVATAAIVSRCCRCCCSTTSAQEFLVAISMLCLKDYFYIFIAVESIISFPFYVFHCIFVGDICWMRPSQIQRFFKDKTNTNRL